MMIEAFSFKSDSSHESESWIEIREIEVFFDTFSILWKGPIGILY